LKVDSRLATTLLQILCFALTTVASLRLPHYSLALCGADCYADGYMSQPYSIADIQKKLAQQDKPTFLDEAFDQVSDELLLMFLKKHRDYGKGNILANQELGISMRVSEKVERLKHLLMTQQSPTNESIEETWIDIAVYGVIAVLLRRGYFSSLNVSE